MDLVALRDPLKKLMDESGDEIMVLRRIFLDSGRIGADKKADRSPVTEADVAAHNVLEAGLPALLDVPIVSEEGAGRDKATMFWLVDPLDGTKEFLKGRDEWTVNVALVADGKPILGMVTAPVLGEAWFGLPESGAWALQQGEWVKINVAFEIGSECKVVASLSHRGARVDGYVQNLQASGLSVNEMSFGSSLKICRVAEGVAHVYPRLGPTMHWDTAAAHAVIDGAGGSLVDVAGRPLRYNRTDWTNPEFIAGCPTADWTSFVPS